MVDLDQELLEIHLHETWKERLNRLKEKLRLAKKEKNQTMIDSIRKKIKELNQKYNPIEKEKQKAAEEMRKRMSKKMRRVATATGIGGAVTGGYIAYRMMKNRRERQKRRS